jgi:Kef-type K+ transport system membrane component KefB
MLQVLVVLGACRVVGWFGTKYLGQAQVTMEMLTGVLLGPSVFGAISPSVQQSLFPQLIVNGDPTSGKHPSMSILYVIAQIGLVLYMFLIGLELDLNLIGSRTKAAISVSIAGIVLPFAFGCIVFYVLLSHRTDMFGANIPIPIQAIYVGAAMCITAFPMLARIIYEAGIAGTPLGTLAIGAGASNDVFAWILLAVVLAVSKGNPAIAFWAIGGGTTFAFLMLTVGKRLLAFLEARDSSDGEVSQTTFALVMIFLFAGAWFTDAIGVYAVFGAFLMGLAMPKGRLSKFLQERIEPITVSLFLPFFFVYSGLNTRIGSLQGAEHWLICLALLAAAMAGKYGGCYFAARACGEPKRQATAIGVLMNSRGLMELIILNIGLQQRVITIPFFTMMVIMAIATTFMAAPLFRRVYRGGFDS